MVICKIVYLMDQTDNICLGVYFEMFSQIICLRGGIFLHWKSLFRFYTVCFQIGHSLPDCVNWQSKLIMVANIWLLSVYSQMKSQSTWNRACKVKSIATWNLQICFAFLYCLRKRIIVILVSIIKTFWLYISKCSLKWLAWAENKNWSTSGNVKWVFSEWLLYSTIAFDNIQCNTRYTYNSIILAHNTMQYHSIL